MTLVQVTAGALSTAGERRGGDANFNFRARGSNFNALWESMSQTPAKPLNISQSTKSKGMEFGEMDTYIDD